MDKSKAREDLERLYNAIPSTKPEDGMMTISWDFMMDLHHNLGRIVTSAAAMQPTTRDEVRLIEAVRNTVRLFSREEMLEAYRCVGRIDALVDRDGTTAQEKAFDTVCQTLDQLNRSMTTIIDALKEFDDAR